MQDEVDATAPEIAVGDVIYETVAGGIARPAVAAIVEFELVAGKFTERHNEAIGPQGSQSIVTRILCRQVTVDTTKT